jgi:hypothetical protein
MLLLAVSLHGAERVIEAVRARLPSTPKLPGVQVDEWLEAGVREADIRRAIGAAAHTKEWFKHIDRGQQLGRIVASGLPAIPQSDLAKTLKQVSDWVYE